MNNADLIAENAKLRELLALAVEDLSSLATSVRINCENIEPCSLCLFSEENTEAIGECPGYEIDGCFKWQHADKLKELSISLTD